MLSGVRFFQVVAYTTGMQTFVTHTPIETGELARRLVESLCGERVYRGTATIITLQGALGAGKTVFAKGVAEALGVTETVTSPTYVIEKTYPLPPNYPWKQLIHIDAYRLQSEEELYTIRWHARAIDPGNIVLVEWPEQMGRGLPDWALSVTFEHVDEHTRRIGIEGCTVTQPQ
jgi:tRNA threonylcarbamoyladenosine biosynthesis protein TsaE